MIQLSELIGHGSLDLSTAVTGGTVTGIGLVGNRIVSVRIGRTSVAAIDVRGIDRDVVTFESDRASSTGESARAGDPRGTRVLDLHGDLLGMISDLTITATGEIDEIALHDGITVRGSRLRAIGSYAAIVDVDADA